jgi:hypothetical protein
MFIAPPAAGACLHASSGINLLTPTAKNKRNFLETSSFLRF